MPPMSCNNLQDSRNTRILMYRNILRDRFPQSNAIASSVHGFSYLKALKELNLLVDDQSATYRTLTHRNSQRTLQCRHLQLVDVRCPPSPVVRNRDRRAENRDRTARINGLEIGRISIRHLSPSGPKLTGAIASEIGNCGMIVPRRRSP